MMSSRHGRSALVERTQIGFRAGASSLAASPRRTFSLRDYHELFSDLDLTPTSGGAHLRVRCPLLAILALGTSFVFGMAAVGVLWIEAGTLGRLSPGALIPFAASAAPAVIAFGFGVWFALWRRDCAIDHQLGLATFRERRWHRWTVTVVHVSGLHATIRPFYVYLHRGSMTGDVIELFAADVRPLVIAHGGPGNVGAVAEQLARDAGIVAVQVRD